MWEPVNIHIFDNYSPGAGILIIYKKKKKSHNKQFIKQ